MRFLGFGKQNKNIDENNKGKNLLKIKLQKFKDQCRNNNKNNKKENDDEISKHIKALEDKNTYVRGNATRALAHYYLNKGDENGITWLLNHENASVKSNVSWVLYGAVLKGRNITPFVPHLTKVLEDKNATVIENTTRALAHYYLNKGDENGITWLLNHENASVRCSTVRALANYYLNKKDEDGIKKLLYHKNTTVRDNTAWMLAYVAQKEDITFAVPALTTKAFEDNANVRKKTGSALAHHYMNKCNQEELNKLLNHEDQNVREGATQALKARSQKARQYL